MSKTELDRDIDNVIAQLDTNGHTLTYHHQKRRELNTILRGAKVEINDCYVNCKQHERLQTLIKENLTLIQNLNIERDKLKNLLNALLKIRNKLNLNHDD